MSFFIAAEYTFRCQVRPSLTTEVTAEGFSGAAEAAPPPAITATDSAAVRATAVVRRAATFRSAESFIEQSVPVHGPRGRRRRSGSPLGTAMRSPPRGCQSFSTLYVLWQDRIVTGSHSTVIPATVDGSDREADGGGAVV